MGNPLDYTTLPLSDQDTLVRPDIEPQYPYLLRITMPEGKVLWVAVSHFGFDEETQTHDFYQGDILVASGPPQAPFNIMRRDILVSQDIDDLLEVQLQQASRQQEYQDQFVKMQKAKEDKGYGR